jgi:hypothetical protein
VEPAPYCTDGLNGECIVDPGPRARDVAGRRVAARATALVALVCPAAVCRILGQPAWLTAGNGDYDTAYRAVAAEVGDTWAGPIVDHHWREAIEAFEDADMARAVKRIAGWPKADGRLSGDRCRTLYEAAVGFDGFGDW